MITGKLKESKAEVTKKISSMGGLIVTKCDKAVAAVISTKGIINIALVYKKNTIERNFILFCYKSEFSFIIFLA